jgi:hypothetical protein
MPLPRVWLTVERLLIALVPVIAGTLIDQQCARRNYTWLLSSHGLQDCGGSTPHREREQAPALHGSDRHGKSLCGVRGLAADPEERPVNACLPKAISAVRLAR